MELPVDRPAIRFSFVTKFDLLTIRGRRLIAPETRPIPETRTRGPIPDYLSIRSGRRGRVEFLIVRRDFPDLSTISERLDYYSDDSFVLNLIIIVPESEILFRFNFHPCVVFG